MPYDPSVHHRRSVRLRGYDYAEPGCYAVTICVHQRRSLFGQIVDAAMQLTPAGVMAQENWQSLPTRFPSIDLDAFVVMPNHMHGIVVLGANPAESLIPSVCLHNASAKPRGTEPGSLARVIQAFKSVTTHAYIAGVRREHWEAFAGHLWQRSYYENIIVSEHTLERMREYIENNVYTWSDDSLRYDSPAEHEEPSR